MVPVRPSKIHTLHPRLPRVASGNTLDDSTNSHPGVDGVLGVVESVGALGEVETERLGIGASANSIPSSATEFFRMMRADADALGAHRSRDAR